METNPTLKDLLARKSQVTGAIADCEAKLKGLIADLADFEAAERLFARWSKDPVVAPDDSDGDGSESERPRVAPSRAAQILAVAAGSDDYDPNERNGNPYRPNTNKAYLWSALYASDEVWFTANELQDLVANMARVMIPMSSISPSLTDMKNDDEIIRDNMRVALARRVPESGTVDDLLG